LVTNEFIDVQLREVVVGDKVLIPQGSRIHFESVDESTQAEKGMSTF
jgi:hypothetical protein